MFRTALITLALVLILPARSSAAGSPAADTANEFAAVVCTNTDTAPPDGAGPQKLNQEAVRAAEPKFQTIQVGPGQKPADLCRDAHLQLGYILYKVPANGRFLAPTVNITTPPAGWDELDMQLNKEAQMQLDAIAAAKVKNKTPEQQTPGQKTSGQQPP